MACAGCKPAVSAVSAGAPPHQATATILVTTTADGGPGSLRQAIVDANARPGPDTIRFDAESGPFKEPQKIVLDSELPELTGEVTIDGYIEGRLWQATGVTLTGRGIWRVLSVAPGARAILASLTVSDGRAPEGAGIVNRGSVVIKGVTLTGNVAQQNGGAIANLGGRLEVINTTIVKNGAGVAGGGVANLGGSLTITNCTMSGNEAPGGGAVFNGGALLLRNSILANSVGPDCASSGTVDAASTHNLIEVNDGCGEPVSTADPVLQSLNWYNGPTQTLPPGGGSPVVNFGDNASAVDEQGQRLPWDQRGNGDPRIVAGITDIGAFEVQAFPKLVVNTVDDTDRRGCSGPGASDCSLRGALTLANAADKPSVITFAPNVFAGPRTLVFARPLPEVTADVTLDLRGTAGVALPEGAVRTAGSGKLTILGATAPQ
jgi:CSLREA domain-containing protein